MGASPREPGPMFGCDDGSPTSMLRSFTLTNGTAFALVALVSVTKIWPVRNVPSYWAAWRLRYSDENSCLDDRR